MTPIVHALRCSLVPFVVLAIVIAVALWPRPPAQVVVMMPVSISAPAAGPVAVPVPVPAWCYDGTWRHASVDLRPWCGWR